MRRCDVCMVVLFTTHMYVWSIRLTLALDPDLSTIPSFDSSQLGKLQYVEQEETIF